MFIIKDDTITIDYKIENNSAKNINNTNIISAEDLIFDIKYFKNNTKLIAGFLNVIVKNEKIKRARVENRELVVPTLEFLNFLPVIESLTIVPDIPVDYEIYLGILKNDTLKSLNCFTIPTYLLEQIDSTKSIKIETRNEVFFISNFLRVNKLDSYSEVFYKRRLTITYEFNEADWQDFKSFLSINAHLRTLYFEYVSMELLKKLLKCLSLFDRKNISFEIKGSEENLKHFGEIENFVKKNKFIKKNNIKFKIDYTKEYKIENFLKLLNFTTLKYFMIGIIFSSIIGYSVNRYDIYKSSEEVNHILDDIPNLLSEYAELNPEIEPAEPEITDEPNEEPSEGSDTPEPTPAPVNPNYVSPYYKDYAKVVSILKETNPDTVGWLSVRGTKVNYPVVIASNNSYYLNHDFNKNLNSLGWVFMDYRNRASNLDQNTIIYGHSTYSNEIMFGSLSNVLKASWLNDDWNHVMIFNTAEADMDWEIFSIYSIDVTDDYLYTNFGTPAEFLEFANMLKARSIHDFGVEINENDKILTLSTCQNRGKKRLVVHARLMQY